MTAITIRKVIVEHNPTDMELIQHELKKNHFNLFVYWYGEHVS